MIELGKYVPDECLNGMIIREQPLYHASSCKFASWCCLAIGCVSNVHFIAHLTYYLNPPPLQQGDGFFYMSYGLMVEDHRSGYLQTHYEEFLYLAHLCPGGVCLLIDLGIVCVICWKSRCNKYVN